MTPSEYLERFASIFERRPVDSVFIPFLECVYRIYDLEVPHKDLKEPIPGSLEHARWLDYQNFKDDFWKNDRLDEFTSDLLDIVVPFLNKLPPSAFIEEEALTATPIIDTDLVNDFVVACTTHKRLTKLKERIWDNIKEDPKPTLPENYKGDAAKHYLSYTPLLDLLHIPIPFVIPLEKRFEHQFLLGGTGSGKTSVMKYQLCKDFETDASVVVIDSQGDLIRTISKIKDIQDRIVLINPRDIAYPPAINLFDVGQANFESYDPLEREQLTNGAIELLEYLMGVLGADLTSKQGVLFRFCARLMLVIPNATINTFREIMEGKHLEHASKLSKVGQEFFATQYNHKDYTATRQQCVRRIWAILENSTVERMFSATRSKLNIKAELDKGSIILVDTAKDLLKADGVELLGRYFIATIALAVQERALQENRRDTFLYIDEFADYSKSPDSYIPTMLSQFRKYRCGLTMAVQALDQVGRLEPIIMSNTSIKMCGGASDSDSRTMAREMRCEVDFIRNQKALSFATSIKGWPTTALTFPVGYMEALETAPLDIDSQRERYARRIDDETPTPIVEHTVHTEPIPQGDTGKDW